VSRILADTDLPPSAAETSRPSPLSITVVIPTFNRVDLLPQTLATVFAQQLEPSEVIVVDDGSTDGTSDYLATMPVTQVRNPRGGWGPARARNEGLSQTTSDLVAFLDSDDLLRPDALSRLSGALAGATSAPFAFGRSLVAAHDAAGWHVMGLMTPDDSELIDPQRSLFARNFVPSVGTLARVGAIRSIGGYPESATWSEDHLFWLRLVQVGDPVFVPAVTSIYRVHPGNRYTAIQAAGDLDHFLALAATDPRFGSAVADRLGVTLCDSVTATLGAGEVGEAARVVRSYLLSKPSKLAILRRAFRHWRRRRAWHAAGPRTLEQEDELRGWLAGQS
jgi:glycosyltransferase involved in cell wall biosynthesis